MNNLITKIIVIISFSLSLSLVVAKDFPLKQPMGGQTFGHSVKNISEGIYVFRWWVYRNIFVVTKTGVIVTDPINPKAAKLLFAEIRQVTDKPIKYVIYSHNHIDHISGGTIFQKEGVQFIAHENILKHLYDHPNKTIPKPDIVFDDSYTLKLDDRTIELTYLGKNHGDSLIVMGLPKEKIMFVVDIVTPRRVAFRGMPDFWPDEWVRSLYKLEKMDFDYVIPGHGPETEPAIELAHAVVEQREYLQDLMRAVKTMMDSGVHNPEELKKKVKLPKYQNWRYYKEWLPMNIERIWAFYHMAW